MGCRVSHNNNPLIAIFCSLGTFARPRPELRPVVAISSSGCCKGIGCHRQGQCVEFVHEKLGVDQMLYTIITNWENAVSTL